MKLKELIQRINLGKSWYYNDFQAIEPEIRQFATMGNEYAAKLEDHFDVVNNETAFDTYKPRLTKYLNAMVAQTNGVDANQALTKQAFNALIRVAGFVHLSGYIPKAAYTLFADTYFALKGAEATPEMQVMRGIYADFIPQLKACKISEHGNPEYGQDDYFDYIRDAQKSVEVSKAIEPKAKKGGAKDA